MRVFLENGTAFCCCSGKELCVVPENALAGTVVLPEQYKREDVPTTWQTKSHWQFSAQGGKLSCPLSIPMIAREVS